MKLRTKKHSVHASGQHTLRNVAERVYGLLLLLYPSSFRREYGGEMLRLFREQYREMAWEGSFWDGFRFWLWLCADTGRAASREHSHSMVAGIRRGLGLQKLDLHHRKQRTDLGILLMGGVVLIAGAAFLLHWSQDGWKERRAKATWVTVVFYPIEDVSLLTPGSKLIKFQVPSEAVDRVRDATEDATDNEGRSLWDTNLYRAIIDPGTYRLYDGVILSGPAGGFLRMPGDRTTR